MSEKKRNAKTARVGLETEKEKSKSQKKNNKKDNLKLGDKTNQFKNDGSFLEMFLKKSNDEKEKEKSLVEKAENEQQTAAAKEEFIQTMKVMEEAGLCAEGRGIGGGMVK
eukprot:Platyproteum_vivax@DN1340_c0_g1_i1.p1